ncbi:hypothetical protein EVAR_72875_1 [Eumeta japonica]|uniref:Uncharacterized protein n=1 Tax=Eumeta variegata TaxID=151549 RepID=A0A4C2A939_EUMVA|nr:hypothetical protein EVAR_72875_1 [Eumeta japonica]
MDTVTLERTLKRLYQDASKRESSLSRKWGLRGEQEPVPGGSACSWRLQRMMEKKKNLRLRESVYGRHFSCQDAIVHDTATFIEGFR